MMKKIAIWGTGKIGRRLYYKIKECNNVSCWYDDEVKEEIYGIPVKTFSWEKKEELIILATSEWEVICRKLVRKGYKVIKDFIPYWLYNDKMINWNSFLKIDATFTDQCIKYIKKEKSIAIVFGNCQTEILQRVLMENDTFSKEYIIFDIPRVCQEGEDVWEKIYDTNLWSECDLFIYQNVLDKNKYGRLRATSCILSRLKSTCITVSIPNIYFDGYFPQIEKNDRNILMDVQEDGMFKWADKYCNIMIEQGMNTQEIIGSLSDKDFIQKKDIMEHVKKSLKCLKEREAVTDIKISDYIEKYYRKKQLFFAPNHPINELIIECAKRVLRKLGMDEDIHYESVTEFYSLMGEDIPIYPSVVDKLGMSSCLKTFFPNRYIEYMSLSFEEYYQLYCRIYRKA